MSSFRSTALALAGAVGMASGVAHAQAASAAPETGAKHTGGKTDLQEVVVTAQKTGPQVLQTVPLAIQAFSGEDLKERNIETVGDLVSSVPGAYVGQVQSVASMSYNLRGAGGSNANGDSPIGYYLDDVPFVVTNFGIAPPIRFLDIDRVEVLRGPQGTLYGQGSSGGVFIFHTRDPNLDHLQFSGEAEGSQTNGAGGLNYGFAGALSVPLIKDVLALRVSGGESYNAGWADEYYGAYTGTPDRKDVNVIRYDDVRVVALFQPASNFQMRAQYWHFRPRQQFTGFLSSVDPPYYDDTAGQPSYSNGDFTLYSLAASWQLKPFTITSATSYLKGHFGIDIPLAPAGAFSSQFFPKMFSEEVRASSNGPGPLHWLLGGAYNDGQGPQANALDIPPFVSINADNNTLTRNWATFGEVSYDLFGGKLVPLAGLRYYRDRRTFSDGQTSNSDTTDVTTWRLNLSYLPSDNLTVFVTAATGFRAGIVQSQVQADLLQQSGIPAGTELKPETSTNYEIGVKWRTPARNLIVDLNAYITKFKDLQTSTPTINPQVSGFSNFGDATTRGLDFEIHWRTPLQGLVLSAVGNVNHSVFDYVQPAVQAALPYLQPGTRLVNSIPYNWRLDASYSGTIKGDWGDFFDFSWSRDGDRLQTTGQVAKAYNTLSMTIGVRKGPHELALFGDNLSDERGPTIIFGAANAGAGLTPRTIGLRYRVNIR